MSFSKVWIVPVLFVVVGCGSAEESPMDTEAYNGFTDTTQVLKNFLEVPFDSLNTDRKVRVEVVETEDQPTPTTVTLLE